MNITQIRNATLLIEYGNKTFLVDPCLGDKGSYPPFPYSNRQDQRNPLVDLPYSIEQLIHVDAVLVTHLHIDHWDEKAEKNIDKAMKIFVQNKADAKIITKSGFSNVEILTESTLFEGVKLTKTKGRHGHGIMPIFMGKTCGVVFQHPNEKSLYVAGDTIWYSEVTKVLKQYQPEIIIVNAGANQLNQGGSLIMDENDVYQVWRSSPQSTIIASHMEAVNHWGLSRQELKAFILSKNEPISILVPDDGDSYSF